MKEHEADAKTADLARLRKPRCTPKAKSAAWTFPRPSGLPEAKRLRQLEEENAKLKKLLAEQMLDAAALRELLSKKSATAA
jgi:putative transposase